MDTDEDRTESVLSVVKEKTNTKNQRKVMDNKFDELAKGLAKSVARSHDS